MATANEIRELEREIDRVHLGHPLLRRPLPSALWRLLAALDEKYHGGLEYYSGHAWRALLDNLVTIIRHPVRWLYSECPRGGPVPEEVDEEVFTEAKDLLDLARRYEAFATVYPHWHRGSIEIAISGTRIIATHSFAKDTRFEAYNRLIQPGDEDLVSPNPSILISLIGDEIRKGTRAPAIPLNLQVARAAMEQIDELQAYAYILPEEWELGGYTLGEFRAVSSAVRGLGLSWSRIRGAVLKGEPVHEPECTGGPLVVSRTRLIDMARRITSVSRPVVAKIIGDLRFASIEEIRDPDPALQPILPLSERKRGLSTLLLMHSSPERNLVTLLNMRAETRRAYLALVDQKEELMRTRVLEHAARTLDRWWGRVSGRDDLPDIDLALIDHESRTILCMELKWFIPPAEIREIHARHEDLEKGVRQCKQLLRALRQDRDLVADTFEVKGNYSVTATVVSANWIGFADVQDPAVPIISERHLGAKLAQAQSLQDVESWLSGRRYLPRKDRDYRVFDHTTDYGRWSVSWYGIEGLAERFLPVD